MESMTECMMASFNLLTFFCIDPPPSPPPLEILLISNVPPIVHVLYLTSHACWGRLPSYLEPGLSLDSEAFVGGMSGGCM